jgi:hypothetical protein
LNGDVVELEGGLGGNIVFFMVGTDSALAKRNSIKDNNTCKVITGNCKT